MFLRTNRECPDISLSLMCLLEMGAREGGEGEGTGNVSGSGGRRQVVYSR